MSVFSLEKQDSIAIITMNDVTQPQNVLNHTIQTDYEAVFSQLEADKAIKGLVFKSGKPGCFWREPIFRCCKV